MHSEKLVSNEIAPRVRRQRANLVWPRLPGQLRPSAIHGGVGLLQPRISGVSLDGRRSVLFMYLGRRGSLGRYTLELAQAVRSMPEISATFAVSAQNEVTKDIELVASELLQLHTFDRAASLSVALNFFFGRRQLIGYIEREKPSAVINLMPHVWTPLLRHAVRRCGIPFVTVIHDAHGHPGDHTNCLTRWLRSEARFADRVIALSRTVADSLVILGVVPAERIRTLFHPDLTYGSALASRERNCNAPLKLLFFGRILKYKGLPLLLDAVEMLRAEGVHIVLGVAGEGDIKSERRRLEALGAEIHNRWLQDAEVGPLLARYDAMAVPYVEASQSGVVATAFGNRMPVIGMPVGGISEQVIDGKTGILANRMTPRALADAIHRLSVDPVLYRDISAHLTATAEDRSMARFVADIVAVVQSAAGCGDQMAVAKLGKRRALSG
jgi:glycosyltransferase involved in cell wall biosynthesis